MSEKHQHNPSGECTTCGRSMGCPGCHRPWPDGKPGYVDDDGAWRAGPRPARAPKTRTGPTPLERAQAAFDTAHSEWESLMQQLRAARRRVSSSPTVLRGGQMVDLIDPAAKAEVHRLEALEEAALEKRRNAGAAVVAARNGDV